MTRYKELKRMQAAMLHRHIPELQWAERWAQSRLSIATRQDHIKTWKKRLSEIRKALETAGA